MGKSIAFDGGIAARYDATRGGRVRAANVVDAIVPWLPSNGPLVELGVGTGIIAEVLTERGFGLVGIDLSREMLERAAARLAGRLAVADAGAVPVRDGAAAGVVGIHVLHLVADLPGVVAGAARMLRSGGRFAVSGVDGDRESSDNDMIDAHGDINVRLRPFPPPSVDRIVAAAAEAGMRLLHDGFQARLAFDRTPKQAARLLADRTWSWCWNLTDEVWANDVQPVIERLLALPEPDRPRPHWLERRFLILERD